MAAPAPRELRERESAEAWLAAGLSLAKVAPTPGEGADALGAWLSAAVAERPALPPLGVIVDLGRLLAGGALGHSAPGPEAWPGLAEALRAYEDHFLARLAGEAQLSACQDAVARLAPPLRPRAVGAVLASVLNELGFAEGVEVSPAVLRRVAERVPAEVHARGREVLREGGPVSQWVLQGYAALARSARRARLLLQESDLVLLESFEALQDYGRRVAMTHVVRAAAQLEASLPARLPPGLHRGELPVESNDEAAYPTGGFASVATRGGLENLVTSELVYMEDGPSALDLFDVRYAEGELLYYTRDESLVVRRRRAFTFALAPSLVRARFKDAGSAWQRGVLVLGLLVALVRRLVRWLSHEGLEVRLVFVGERGARSPLLLERGLAEVLLREWIARGVVRLEEAATSVEAAARAAQDARRAQAAWVGFCAGDDLPLSEVDGARVRAALVDVSQAVPRLGWGPVGPAAAGVESPWPQLAAALLTGLV